MGALAEKLICDGCAAPADQTHLRRRIERLELASRFRPIHIRVLFLDSAPPLRPEDYFYRPAKDRSERSLASRMFFDELAKCTGAASGSEPEEEKALEDFQHCGFFLNHTVECPLDPGSNCEEFLLRLWPTVLRRIQASYKPKFIAPLSQSMRALVPLLAGAGWGDRLVLSNGGPFFDPFLGDPQNQAEFGTALGDQLSKAIALLP